MKKARHSGWGFLVGPPALYLAVFFILPIAYMVIFSFWRYSQTNLVIREFTLENYRELLSPYYLRLFWRTVRVALATTIVAAVIGFPLAYFIARAKPSIKSIAIFLIISPLMISTVVRVFGTTLLIGRNGIINQILVALDLPRMQIIQTETAIVIGLLQMLLPFMVLPIVSAIERIPSNLEEAATNLGANWYRVFTTTILPLSLPGVISGAILVYTISVSALIVPTLLGGAGDRMIGQQIYDQMFVAYNWPAASALSVVLVVVTALAACLGIVAAASSRKTGRPT
jgi:putative spermidine/putrescine transport system permease protein